MRTPLLLVAMALIFLSSAVAQSKRDWDSVRRISRGTLIEVKAWRNAKCEFRGATDDKLLCDDLSSGEVLTFNRRDIRQIRREFTNQTKGHIGAAAGAGIGAAVGASVHSDRSGYTRGGDAIGGGFVGGVAGWMIASNTPIFHGGIIYKW